MIDGEALALLTDWLPSNDDPDRPRIQLATVDATLRPDVRTVLLTAWDERGFTFHTDAASRKAEQLATHAAVALAVLWPGFSRQLVVRGRAEALTAPELDTAYRDRSPYLQQLAWQNTVELAQRDRAERVAEWLRFAAEHAEGSLRAPATWAGYRVVADRLTFWSADPEGPSHRVEFRRDGDGPWTRHELAG